MKHSVTKKLRGFAAVIGELSPKGGRSSAAPRRLPRAPVQALIVPLSTATAALLLISVTQMDFTEHRWTRGTAQTQVKADSSGVHPEGAARALAARQTAPFEAHFARAPRVISDWDHDAIAGRTAGHRAREGEETLALATPETSEFDLYGFAVSMADHQATEAEESFALTATSPEAALQAEIECLAKNIYFEARSESDLGKLAVGQVVMNRVASKRFPGGICDVVRQGGEIKRFRCQFSWWCDGKSDKPNNQKAWQRSMELARNIYGGRTEDPTGGALWYHADYVDPYWRSAFNEGPKIGRHIFYTAKAKVARTQLAEVPRAD